MAFEVLLKMLYRKIMEYYAKNFKFVSLGGVEKPFIYFLRFIEIGDLYQRQGL